MTDLVKLYNPASAAALTPNDIAGLQKLTDAELKELAKVYSNNVMQRAYLLIIDTRKPVHKQLPTLSSFENLYNLRTRNAMKSYVAYGFKGSKAKPVQVAKGRTQRRVEVLDLSDAELLSLPGFKTIPATEVKVKKIGKSKPVVEIQLVDEMKTGVEILSSETKTT